ncbi:hypothetical protein H8M03_01915 [Sphingomonas sabuli]|uniref:Sulfotransferase family protein n=1 Tax=Sphingomonas sabuli TaxID=2764186 RepID=A0A7G9L3E2_9SPHN|nr:hypothetical protein [Sphingomonas sabuli]QNM83141.1 hypothetical protein H8M03_01915 [Sphingomonas sabuli]
MIHRITIPIEQGRDESRGMLPRDDGTLLIHIPKCAGVSLRNALNLPYLGHRLLRDFSLRQKDEAKRIVFCTRDPFERAVSTFYYLKRLERARPLLYRAALYPRVSSFSDFIYSSEYEMLEAHNFFFRSQFAYLEGIDDYRDKAIHLRVERLAEDIQRHFGLALPHLNATERTLDETIDTSGNQARIREVYRVDYELLPGLVSR